jgi:formylglycine-generating enzyme required for sulfatase activity
MPSSKFAANKKRTRQVVKGGSMKKLRRPSKTAWAAGLAAALMVSAVSAKEQSKTLEMQFVKIEPGSFQMGCSPDDSECYDNEKPVHTVRITKGFELGKYEVTLKEWDTIMETKPSRPSQFPAKLLLYGAATGEQAEKLPVKSISWNRAQEFIRKMNDRKDGYQYRLPTEAEWEYAARAGTTSRFGGTGDLKKVAWYWDRSDPEIYEFPHQVGKKEPNAWGLHDMLGNVSEWVQDWYDSYEPGTFTDPHGPSSGSRKVMRGGHRAVEARETRVSNRRSLEAGSSYANLGFRLLRERTATR